MKKSVKTIVIITAMWFMLVCAYLLGTTQAETIKEIQTVTETKKVALDDENIVDMQTIVNFSVSEYGLQLYFNDGSGYFLER